LSYFVLNLSGTLSPYESLSIQNYPYILTFSGFLEFLLMFFLENM
jgi:hypothetical protein